MAEIKGNDVVFRRVNGRIVPIKVKKPSGPSVSQMATAASNAAFASTSVFVATKKAALTFRAKSKQAESIIRKIKRVEAPTMPTGLGRTKTGRPKKIAPDIFEMSAYNKKQARFTRLNNRLPNLAKVAARTSKLGNFYRKAAIPASLVAGVVSGLASLGGND